MAHKRIYPVRNTPLSESVRSIRRRLGLGQIGFTTILSGKISAGEISRYESGQVVPSIKMLVALLRCAETPEEREPILEALRAQGIEELLSDLRATHLIPASDHQTSIHFPQLECNIAPEMMAAMRQALDPSSASPGDPA